MGRKHLPEQLPLPLEKPNLTPLVGGVRRDGKQGTREKSEKERMKEKTEKTKIVPEKRE